MNSLDRSQRGISGKTVVVNNVYATSATIEPWSRNELLAFVNNFLKANFTRIEELSTGAAYCQLTELLFPGKISLKKVKWNSKNEIDWITNWNVLQKAWKDLGVTKAVPVERLLRAKFQENFEFLQWFKKFFDANYQGQKYDALEARNGEPLPASWSISSKAVSQRTSRAAKNPVLKSEGNKRSTVTTMVSTSKTIGLQRKYELIIQQLKEEVAQLVDQRDFYIGKLRAIETICRAAVGNPTISREEIEDVLFASEEGFSIAEDFFDDESTEENNNLNDGTGDATRSVILK